MPVSALQSAVLAILTEVVGLLVAFAVIDNNTATIVVSSATQVVAAAFVIANAIIHHGVTTATGKDPHA